MNLSKYTNAELQELKELLSNEETKRKRSNEVPMLNPNPNWSSVTKLGQEIVRTIVDGTYHDDNDDAQYMYEEVMKALYGKNYFDWHNKNT